jgi:hypothetical protein
MGLPRLKLPTRKFPVTGVAFVGCASGDKNLLILMDDAADDAYNWVHAIKLHISFVR